ncbi:nitrate ABC transporter permease [Opitutaceae bacterium EW11]|nr:nitrate ABC transporter permease [Opitutaceae bacterium EW11]
MNEASNALPSLRSRLDALAVAGVRNLGIPLVAIAIFVGAWSLAARTIQVSFGSLPGPAAVATEIGHLWQDHQAERAREQAFYERQAERKKAFLEKNPAGEWKERKYAGRPTFFDQIGTSLKTVFTGFVIASLIAVPLGVLCGLSKTFNLAVNPFVQLFKPVSPLAWLPIVMILVSALYNPAHPLFEKAFLSSAITVALCSLWPTLINTALGVSSIDQDYLNVARVLRLGWFAKVWKIVLPASLPLIFTGLRLSLGVGWMVLIAAEMLAQNPGLGKFVWDMFQNGSSQTLAQIEVAVLVIGLIGFALDRAMLALQRAVSFGSQAR